MEITIDLWISLNRTCFPNIKNVNIPLLSTTVTPGCKLIYIIHLIDLPYLQNNYFLISSSYSTPCNSRQYMLRYLPAIFGVTLHP